MRSLLAFLASLAILGGGSSISSQPSAGSAASSLAIGSDQPASSSMPTTFSGPVPILIYHHVRPQEGWSMQTWSWKMTVTPQIFEQQTQWLEDHGYTTVSMDTLTAILDGTIVDIPKPVVITFDDNNLNQYEVALPILEAHHQIAVFYLIANKLENVQTINRQRAKDLAERGMDIQSHTVTHSALTNLSIAALDHELTESKRILEEVTGKPVRHIAYPLTTHNAVVRDHAKNAGYITGTIMDPRTASSKDDRMKLPRIMMTDETDLAKVLP